MIKKEDGGIGARTNTVIVLGSGLAHGYRWF